ncbi:MAG: HAD family hydrolase [Anaerolineae bacterium]|nr:HAD family hydrolase [Anaerolineae bacterium]
MSHPILAVCLDCGDTLVDEGTEIKNYLEETQTADLIPGAAQMVRDLKARGYPLALVADGPTATFRNVLTHYQLYDLFDAFAISAELGTEKPDARMFRHALDQLGIAESDYGRVVMVGNHLGRDVKGANGVGIISVWLNWSPRRHKIPVDDTEIPQHTILTPAELIPLLERIEADGRA